MTNQSAVIKLDGINAGDHGNKVGQTLPYLPLIVVASIHC
jgi:hypothetical protein